jgi:hypothetical protein
MVRVWSVVTCMLTFHVMNYIDKRAKHAVATPWTLSAIELFQQVQIGLILTLFII